VFFLEHLMVNKIKLPYDPKSKQVARMLRKHSTLAEILLWNALKGKKMLGYDFHRQKPTDRFVVDYYCPGLKLVLEIDGVTHEEKEKEDRIRQKTLESFGPFVLRFRDEEVKQNLDGVLSALQEWIERRIQTSKSTHP
jgi:very-short-patch-repair endonuclease